ncbi:hypothetical protein [Leisingera sp. S232]|uniref:hypothetical protein n=1 Tax=Leisingera sp. S232 TaxID=3415132 RepID=UPI003C7C8AE2
MNKITQDTPVQGPPAPASFQTKPAQAEQTQVEQTQVEQTRADPVRNPPAAAQDQSAQDQPEQGKSERLQDKPMQPPRLSAAVLAQIATALRQGEAPLAAQADLVALHKRIAGMFATLNDGLGAQAMQKAADDRAALSARIDQLEAAVNRMEGALRIEFEPVLKAALAEALAQAAPRPRRRWPAALAVLAMATVALAAGAWWHGPLLDAAASLALRLGAPI